MNKILSFILLFIATSVGAQSAEQIIDQYFKAMGGKNIEKVKAISQKGFMSSNGMEFPMENYQDLDGRLVTKMNLMGTDIVAVAFDGKKGYVFDQMTFGYKDIPDSLANNYREKAQNIFGYFYQYKQKGHKAKYLGKQTIQDKTYDKVQLLFSKPMEGLNDVIAYFDPETHLLSMVEVKKDKYTILTKPKNYKKVDGVTFPFALDIEVDGKVMSNLKFDEIKVNPPQPDKSIFTKPKQ